MLVWHVSLRYLRTRRAAWLALAAVTLSVAAPVAVMGVMQGWVDIMARQIRAAETDLSIRHLSEDITDPHSYSAQISALPEIEAAAPFVKGAAMMCPQYRGVFTSAANIPCQVEGISWKDEERIHRLSPSMLHPPPIEDLKAPDLPPEERGSGFLTPLWRSHLALSGLDMAVGMGCMPAALPPRFRPRAGAILGRELIYGEMGGHLQTGQALRLILPNGKGGLTGEVLVEASDTLGTGVMEIDKTMVLLPFNIGGALMGLKDAASGIRIDVAPHTNLDDARTLLGRHLPPVPGSYDIIRWDEQASRNMLESIKVQKNILFFIMIIVVIISVFIVYAVFSTLVSEKRHDIGTLMGIGARRSQIVGIFLAAGLLTTLIGGFLGWGIGWLLLGVLLPLAETQLGISLFPQDVFYTPEAPVSWDPIIPLTFMGISLVVGLIGTVLPALQASRIDPIHTLRENG